jgi:hypothetical protein
VDYFSPEENEVFAVARQMMEGFVQSRPGYEPKVNFAFFAAGASHMRMSLNAVPQSEAVPSILYRQWLVAPSGKSTCTLAVGESTTTLSLNFRQPTNAIADQLRIWLFRELPQ